MGIFRSFGDGDEVKAILSSPHLLESCPSGLWSYLGKVVWGQTHREFESPRFRNLRLAAGASRPILGNGWAT